MTTLVLCVDRSNDVGQAAGVRTPVAGWEAVRSLVTDVGLADPEDSIVNCILESLRVTRELRDGDEDAVVAVVSGGADSLVGADRSLAAQLDQLVARYDPDAAVVVVDSAHDERVVPVVESRLPVDSVDRVVVRQARDIESTYYLLKQFLADEELRTTVLVPLGIALLLLPALLFRFDAEVAVGVVASLLGAALLYKGLAVDVRLEIANDRVREALYAGQVSVVTYVVAAGLTLVGVFVGALEVSELSTGDAVLVPTMQFAYSSVPWLALAALTASTGRLLDELIRDEGVRTPFLNLPFGVVAVGLVVRGFSGYFLEREGYVEPALFAGVALSPAERLALFVVSGIVLSLCGVVVASSFGEGGLDEVIEQ